MHCDVILSCVSWDQSSVAMQMGRHAKGSTHHTLQSGPFLLQRTRNAYQELTSSEATTLSDMQQASNSSLYKLLTCSAFECLSAMHGTSSAVMVCTILLAYHACMSQAKPGDG